MIITDFANIMATIGGSSIISSGITYLFAKRKYRTETDSVEIQNLQEGIKVYKEIIDDLKLEYKELKAEYKELKKEVDNMKLDFEKKLTQAKENCK